MKSLRFWTLVLSATWFLAGFAAGHLVSASESESSRLARYADRLTAEFDLDGLRRSGLIQVLDSFERQRIDIQNRHAALAREAMEPELRELHRAKSDLIRNTILPPDQRQRFDELSQPVPLPVD